jgi:hypothetical protein
MANKDIPHGFVPWGEVLRARYYPVPTAPTINICVGDIVASDLSTINSAKLGYVLSVYDAAVLSATPGDEQKALGSVLACFDEDMFPIQYIAATRVGDSTTAGYVLVADHPDQQYEAQGDGVFTAADLNLNYAITSATLCAPSTFTGLSTQEITAASGNAVTTTIPIRIYGQAYPGEDVISAAGCRMICQINPDCHHFGAAVML